ncbi:furin-like protease 1 isoform X2 [Venturia canescens]|uniref:furin-like protease 1 isoform X2 n=1 Tax=Venturia canescens TaxID=32260 RepID=UPI001C9D37D0|nr:furin-like protease 1 isoform X2 [Venturia canescens]
MCVDKWILTFGVVAFGILGRAEAWTHQWAAHIEGGSRVARQVAEDHGFIYADPIIGDWHHLVHRSVKKRSTEPHLEVHRRLTKDPRVRRAEQQRAKSRSKRDLIEICPESPQIWFNDKGWPVTWYANRGHCLDMNVIPAWREGITGRGVVISILDDGLETDHPDLIANYDRYASYDVNSHDDDPMPRYDMIDSNRHGTRCAGEVAAAANNSICSVGIAYGASIGGVRMLDGDVTDAVEAKSLSHHPQHIDIYSASWGPDDDGKTVDGPGELATRAFNEGITKGRKGKGSIFIWASGNGGRDHDNCNCDGYTNSIWTLSISSATENGLVPWYSEACSSTLATTYSSGSTGERQVVTTDLHHQCTNNHTGTSASAPLAAGICALALEANPNLTWRDMQHIVVRTARPENLKAPDWITNGVRRNVSHSFGYGLMDAAAMVRLARKWKTVPEQKKCEVSAPYSGRQIPAKSQLVLKLDVRECTEVNYLEHVQAKISLTAMRRGDLQIQLTSPNGTRSTLLAKRPHDNSKAGFNQWPFMSVHTWGEMPHGVWKLEIHNEGRYLGRATLHEWALIFYGTSSLPDRQEYGLYNAARVNPARKPFVKARESIVSKNALLNGYAGKMKQSQHSSSSSSSTSQGYTMTSSGNGSPKKSKLRGQHKNGKSANRGSSRPTVQTLRGLAPYRGGNVFNPGADDRATVIESTKPRGKSTFLPLQQTTNKPRTLLTSTLKTSDFLTHPARLRVPQIPTVSSLQRGLILMEPAPAKSSTNRVPIVFQQYPKIQQLYPLYPVYAGARGAGPEHPSRLKGLELLQDQQFDTRNLHLPDKDTLEEWNMVFYGTEKALDIDEGLDKDKPIPMPPEVPEIVNENTDTYGIRPNVVDADELPWTGSQKVDQISHPEVQKPTTENQTSGAAGCIRNDTRGCLECDRSGHLYEGLCLTECPKNTYPVSDDRKSVCSICHYSCESCSGGSNNECKSCHSDATLISMYNGDSQCIQKSLEWKSQSTKWFYYMSILLGLNLTLAVGVIIYLYLSRIVENRNNQNGLYNYNKLLSPEEEKTKHEEQLLPARNGCLSDSD